MKTIIVNIKCVSNEAVRRILFAFAEKSYIIVFGTKKEYEAYNNHLFAHGIHCDEFYKMTNKTQVFEYLDENPNFEILFAIDIKSDSWRRRGVTCLEVK